MPRRRVPLETFATPVVRPVPVAAAMLVGANLAFLASNLTDSWWIGVRHRAPDGVDLTDYLHSGTYSLMADVVIATLLLLLLFRDGASARVSKPVKLLGSLLLAQCVWLGFGVAGRVVMQIDRLGFTPNRIWILVILAWGYAGFYGATRYQRARPSFREFARHAVWSAVAILSLLQFRPPAMLSVDLNLAGFRSHPQWCFDEAYYARVGGEGYRLNRAVAEAEPDSERGKKQETLKARWKPAGADAGLSWRVRGMRDVAGMEWVSGNGEFYDGDGRR